MEKHYMKMDGLPTCANYPNQQCHNTPNLESWSFNKKRRQQIVGVL